MIHCARIYPWRRQVPAKLTDFHRKSGGLPHLSRPPLTVEVFLNFSDFDFHPHIAAGVSALGYETPTPIQAEAIPHVMAGRDVMGLAQTGTGKTAAFALPILQRLLLGPKGRVRALVIAPTRELAEQIHESFRALGRDTGVRSTVVYGGVGFGGQVERLQRG